MDIDHESSNGSPACDQDSATPSAGASAPVKPPRPQRSCDFCRRLKIKCERQMLSERCAQCIARNVQCVRTLAPQKPRTNTKKNYLLSMEARIKQMESLLTAAIASTERSDQSAAGISDIERQVGIPDSSSTIVINEQGGFQYVGSSSGFSLFSPRGLRWVSGKTGEQNLERLFSQVLRLDQAMWDQGSWSSLVNIAWHPLPVRQRELFPPKDLALEYVEAFFLSLNSVFPLLSRKTFDENFNRQYSGNPPPENAWYSCFNMVLAIGSMILRARYPLTDPSIPVLTLLESPEEPAARYLRNATSTILDLQFGGASLMSVQAVILMIFMLQGTSNPMTAYTLAATAARLAHAVGLHRWLDDFGISDEQADERRNVFWVLYILDKGICLQTGRPPLMHDQDIGVSLPKEEEGTVFPSGTPKVNTFRIAAELAMIESRVYSELYSARSQTKSPLQKLKAVGELDNALEKWRDAIPIEIRPDYEILCDDQQLLPVIVLHYSYYNCLSAVHRVSIGNGPWTSESTKYDTIPPDIQLNPRVYESEAICVSSARSVISLLDHFRRDRPPPMIWVALNQPLCATLSLFANILQRPQDPHTAADLGGINLVVSLLGVLVAQGQLYFATGTLLIFKEIYRIAELFVTNDHQQTQEMLDISSATLGNIPEIPRKTMPAPNLPNTDITQAHLLNTQFFDMLPQNGQYDDDMLTYLDPQNSYNIDNEAGISGSAFFSPQDI